MSLVGQTYKVEFVDAANRSFSKLISESSQVGIATTGTNVLKPLIGILNANVEIKLLISITNFVDFY
jgi:hypothetical protein